MPTKVCKKMKGGKSKSRSSLQSTAPSPMATAEIHLRAYDSWVHDSCRICSHPACHGRRSEIPIVEGRLKSCSIGTAVLGGTGNKYDAGRCGISDGTLGNASKMSRSKAISFLADGAIERSEPGASGMMGGSMGDCSGITSSGSSNIDFVFVALWRRRSAKELALETLRRGERRKDPGALSLFPLLLLRIENILRMLIVSLPC